MGIKTGRHSTNYVFAAELIVGCSWKNLLLSVLICRVEVVLHQWDSNLRQPIFIQCSGLNSQNVRKMAACTHILHYLVIPAVEVVACLNMGTCFSHGKKNLLQRRVAFIMCIISFRIDILSLYNRSNINFLFLSLLCYKAKISTFLTSAFSILILISYNFKQS